MKKGSPLQGPEFDWQQAREAQQNVVGEDGEVNWRAAHAADPGVVRCWGCREYVWAEAPVMRCDCGSLCGRDVDRLVRAKLTDLGDLIKRVFQRLDVTVDWEQVRRAVAEDES